jgi:hypothetical protein
MSLDILLGEATTQLVRDYCKLHGPFETRLKHVRGTIPVYKLACKESKGGNHALPS